MVKDNVNIRIPRSGSKAKYTGGYQKSCFVGSSCVCGFLGPLPEPSMALKRLPCSDKDGQCGLHSSLSNFPDGLKLWPLRSHFRIFALTSVVKELVLQITSRKIWRWFLGSTSNLQACAPWRAVLCEVHVSRMHSCPDKCRL